MKIQAHVTKVNGESSIKAYADITVENCCTLYNMRVVENKDSGELFVSFPQKPAMKDNEPQFYPDGTPMYNDIYYPYVPVKNDKGEIVNDTEAANAIRAKIFDLVLAAYNNENGRAYINPQKGEFVNAKVEPQIYPCSGEVHKAAGCLLVGGYIKVPNMFVDLRTDKNNDQLLIVSYPHYEKDGKFKNFVEPLTKGKVWDNKAKEEKDYNFKRAVEGAMKKQTKEFHPELASLAEGKVQEAIDAAKEQAASESPEQDKVADKEATM